MLVDNTFATPVLQQPLDLGAALSCTAPPSSCGGHGDVVGRRHRLRREDRPAPPAAPSPARSCTPSPRTCCTGAWRPCRYGFARSRAAPGRRRVARDAAGGARGALTRVRRVRSARAGRHAAVRSWRDDRDRACRRLRSRGRTDGRAPALHPRGVARRRRHRSSSIPRLSPTAPCSRMRSRPTGWCASRSASRRPGRPHRRPCAGVRRFDPSRRGSPRLRSLRAEPPAKRQAVRAARRADSSSRPSGDCASSSTSVDSTSLRTLPTAMPKTP